MPSETFDNKTVLRRKLWVPWGAAIVLSLAAWIVAMAALAGKNLLSGTPIDSGMQHLYVSIAIVVTVLSIPVALLAVRNIQILLARGVWTTAAVESISTVSKGGARPVTFSYVVNQKTYRIKRDVPGQYTREYRKGTPISLVYDPQRPERCYPLFKARSS